jgi:hypothetical protein
VAHPVLELQSQVGLSMNWDLVHPYHSAANNGKRASTGHETDLIAPPSKNPQFQQCATQAHLEVVYIAVLVVCFADGAFSKAPAIRTSATSDGEGP